MTDNANYAMYIRSYKVVPEMRYGFEGCWDLTRMIACIEQLITYIYIQIMLCEVRVGVKTPYLYPTVVVKSIGKLQEGFNSCF